MSSSLTRPGDVARRLADRRDHAARGRSRDGSASDQWRRDTFTLPRDQAREKAREMLHRFPKAAYMTEIEWWRELEDGRIEFTMRRLPSAD
jgi:hypothetical protein